MTFIEFCLLVRSLSRIHGFSVTSWGRTVLHNKVLGGLVNSWHLDFMGVDGVLDNPTMMKYLIEDARALGLDAVEEGDHVHLEPAGRRELKAGGV